MVVEAFSSEVFDGTWLISAKKAIPAPLTSQGVTNARPVDMIIIILLLASWEIEPKLNVFSQ